MPAAQRRSVLVVDDNRDGAESLAELVRLLGHDAQVVYDGHSAIEEVRRAPPDVVFCDIGLPDVSGYEVARALRAAGVRRTRLFAVSGTCSPRISGRPTRRASTGTSPSHLPSRR
jgi:CheY-like chemotaxis protein